MMIPVEVQQPNKPHSALIVGKADSRLPAGAVAAIVGVPEGCLIDGKVIRRKGKARWSLVANIEIKMVSVDGDAREEYCPFCNSKWRDHTCP